MFNMIKRMSKNEGGFTLIELLVVILILGILLAIALPTFLNQQDKAKDSEAQVTLNTAYKVAKSEAATNEGNFPAAASLVTAISDSEPEIDVVTVTTDSSTVPTSADGKDLYVITSSGDDLTLASRSGSGTVYQLDVANGGAPVVTP